MKSFCKTPPTHFAVVPQDLRAQILKKTARKVGKITFMNKELVGRRMTLRDIGVENNVRDPDTLQAELVE